MPKVEGTMLSRKGKALLVFFVGGTAMRLGAPWPGGCQRGLVMTRKTLLGTARVAAVEEAVAIIVLGVDAAARVDVVVLGDAGSDDPYRRVPPAAASRRLHT
ncbi:unnamed protein product [marine sediment metagenome]|uniref:Uncharacterized protein n=1 Tax=marine sediment metagenome TaxID=412755 RepID=X0SF07_9ZZZZ